MSLKPSTTSSPPTLNTSLSSSGPGPGQVRLDVRVGKVKVRLGPAQRTQRPELDIPYFLFHHHHQHKNTKIIASLNELESNASQACCLNNRSFLKETPHLTPVMVAPQAMRSTSTDPLVSVTLVTWSTVLVRRFSKN